MPTEQPPQDDAASPERGTYEMMDLGLEQKVHLPFLSIVFMTVGNVRNRLGRSLVTLFGVVLGTAFLMAVGSAGFIRGTLTVQEANRTEAAAAVANIGAEMGALRGRTLALFVERWDDFTLRLLQRLGEHVDIRLQIYAPDAPEAQDLGEPARSRVEAVAGADALIICNHAAQETAGDIPPEAAALREKIVMDLEGLYDAEELSRQGLHYTDLRHVKSTALGGISAEIPSQQDQGARTAWLIGVSLLVSGIGIANALLMSVTERFREIGTLKCLGSRDRLVIELFIIESGVLGFVGSILGAVVGLLIAIAGNTATYGWATVQSNLPWRSLLGFGLISLAIGLVVAMAAAIYPAFVAARMTPADALRSEV